MGFIYLIYCKSGDRESYYAKGIRIMNIPFEKFETVEIQKIEIVNHPRIPSGCIIYNLMPSIQMFQIGWRRRLAWIRNPRHLLARELTGKSLRPPSPFFQKAPLPQ